MQVEKLSDLRRDFRKLVLGHCAWSVRWRESIREGGRETHTLENLKIHKQSDLGRKGGQLVSVQIELLKVYKQTNLGRERDDSIPGNFF